MPGRPSDNPALVICWTVDHDRAVTFVARQLERDKGNLSAAAMALGISRRTLHRWILADKDLARTVKKARQDRPTTA